MVIFFKFQIHDNQTESVMLLSRPRLTYFMTRHNHCVLSNCETSENVFRVVRNSLGHQCPMSKTPNIKYKIQLQNSYVKNLKSENDCLQHHYFY